MLNRTNRTLSATLNRLNLGTRSLVLLENGISGKDSLRIHHDQDFAMRARMFASSDPEIRPQSPIRIPGILGSPSVVLSWPSVAVIVRPPATESEPATCRAYSPKEYARGSQAQDQSQTLAKRNKRFANPKRKSDQDLRSVSGRTLGTTGTRNAVNTAAAIVAVAGG